MIRKASSRKKHWPPEACKETESFQWEEAPKQRGGRGAFPKRSAWLVGGRQFRGGLSGQGTRSEGHGRARKSFRGPKQSILF